MSVKACVEKLRLQLIVVVKCVLCVSSYEDTCIDSLEEETFLKVVLALAEKGLYGRDEFCLQTTFVGLKEP